MFSQAKRLEFVIVAAAFLVLLFCRRPPRSGNAGVTVDAEPVGQRAPSAFPPPGKFTAAYSPLPLIIVALTTAGLSGLLDLTVMSLL